MLVYNNWRPDVCKEHWALLLASCKRPLSCLLENTTSLWGHSSSFIWFYPAAPTAALWGSQKSCHIRSSDENQLWPLLATDQVKHLLKSKPNLKVYWSFVLDILKGHMGCFWPRKVLCDIRLLWAHSYACPTSAKFLTHQWVPVLWWHKNTSSQF